MVQHGSVPNAGESLPETYFAPAARASEGDLRQAIAVASQNPIIDTVMRNFGGLLAVLNEQRQILSVNDALLHSLGLGEAAPALGLRPGEALHCAHADEHPGGCGTSRFCSNCGAVMAMMAALESGQPEERDCALSVRRLGQTLDVDFCVRCCPIRIQGQSMLLLFLRDISDETRRGALERIFFHDVSNLLTSLCVAGDLLSSMPNDSELVKNIQQAIALLTKEVEVQRVMAQTDTGEGLAAPQETSVVQILDKMRRIYVTHPAAKGKTLIVTSPAADVILKADTGLVIRVLMNMVTNALEASRPGEEVRLWALASENDVTLMAWNRQTIPPDVGLRVFQRYFSTKPGPGRGLGTYTMKWLAERYLKGRIDFTSTETDGTTFRLHLPRCP